MRVHVLYVAGSGHDWVVCSLEERYPRPAGGWGPPTRVEAGRGGVAFWSDGVERESRWRYETTWFARAFEVIDCAAVVVEVDAGEQALLVLRRQECDFDEHDRRRLNALRPFIATQIRNAEARRRLADLMEAVDSVDPAEPHGFVLLRGARIDYASPSALVLLARWFGEHDGLLPAQVEDWRGADPRPGPLLVDRAGRRLTIEAPTSGALLLSEVPAPPRCLTPRELEVLQALADGNSTAEIARLLWVTPATVSKHLEHVYRKLGVNSRTAALAASGVGLRPPRSG